MLVLIAIPMAVVAVGIPASRLFSDTEPKKQQGPATAEERDQRQHDREAKPDAGLVIALFVAVVVPVTACVVAPFVLARRRRRRGADPPPVAHESSGASKPAAP